jgi:predicted ATPase
MKIARAVIENFRQIEHLELDFTDSLGRVRDLLLLVGPNASGKTTVLDALALAVGIPTKLPCLRRGMSLRPSAVVRRGALRARVTCVVRFCQEEVVATRELLRLAEESLPVPDLSEVRLTWELPDPDENSQLGRVTIEPTEASVLFTTRRKTAHLISTGLLSTAALERAGAVFTFDQQRTGIGRWVRRDILDIIQGRTPGEATDGDRVFEPQEILTVLAVESLVPSENGQSREAFKDVQGRFAEICAPHRIVGAVRNDQDELTVVFSDGRHDFGYGGLSSGEQMVLLFLLKMAAEHIHQSVVLVDEIELHQHPLWQRKLLHLLPKMGDDNQIIATTHSAYLRDVVPRGALVRLGELGDKDAGREAG